MPITGKQISGLQQEARNLLKAQGFSSPTGVQVGGLVNRLRQEKTFEQAKNKVTEAKRSVSATPPFQGPQIGGTAGIMGKTDFSPSDIRTQSAFSASPDSFTQVSPLTTKGPMGTTTTGQTTFQAPRGISTFTPTAFQSQLENIMRNRLSGQNQALFQARQGVSGQLVGLPEELARIKGFEGLSLQQAKRLKDIEAAGLGSLVQGLTGLGEQRQRQIERLSEQATQAFTERQELTKESEPIEIGGQLIQKQPDGSYKVVFSAATEKANVQFVPPQFDQLGNMTFPPSVFDKDRQTLKPISGGEAIPASTLGIGSGGTEGYVNVQGMRTDRHNNPTAFTTDLAKQAGLKQGVDYEVGDSFDNNGDGKIDGYTARLLGDSINSTIKLIDNVGFYTAKGSPRWTHTAISKQEWEVLSLTQKKEVVKKMYQKEGGNGSLFGEGQVSQIKVGTLEDAASKGYISPAEIALYKSIISQGGSPPNLKEAKSLSDTQRLSSAYAQRMEQAILDLDNIEPEISSLSTSEFFIQRKLPDIAKNQLIRLQEQAERNFINALLRKESGANIPTAEMENYRQQYFPMPGDGLDVLAQKKRNRNIALQGMIETAASAFTPLSKSGESRSVKLQSPTGEIYEWSDPNDPEIQEALNNDYKQV